MKRRFLSILFTLCMLFSLTPTTVLADETGITVPVSTTEELKNALNKSTVKNININGTITLDGEYNTTGKTISGGTVETNSTLKFTGDGKIYSSVVIQRNGTLDGGNFYGSVTNNWLIQNGTFNGEVINNVEISKGIFNNTVGGQGEIDDGEFNGEVLQVLLIIGGKFHNIVSGLFNETDIKGGTFYKDVSNIRAIQGGVFYGKVDNDISIWDSAKVSVVFKDGENTIEEQKVLKGQKASQPNDPSKEGYTFIGWYTSANCDSTTAYNFNEPVVEPKILYAGWSMNTYTVTFKDGESVLQSTVNHGSTVRPPERVMKPGYTFDGWYTDENYTTKYDFNNKITGDLTLYAKWNVNQYTITVHPDNGADDIVIKQDYGTDVTTPTLTKEGYTFKGWSTTFPTTMPNNDMEITALWEDVTSPTGKIQISDKTWNQFFNQITFGLFFKDTQKVTITGSDTSGEPVTIEYLLSNKEISSDELVNKTFMKYDGSFNIDPNNEYIVYVKITDPAGNVTYISSDGVVLDRVVPVISGIEDGKTYCESKKVTVKDDYLDSVTVNGNVVNLDSENSFILSPSDSQQTIVVKDKAGNTTEMRVTINDGHTGGTATCKDKAKCSICGKEYGKLNATNHTNLTYIPAVASTTEKTGNLAYWHCTGCGKYFSDKKGTKEIALKDTITSKLPPKMISKSGPIIEINKKYGVKHKKTYDVINDSAGEKLEQYLKFKSNASFSDFIRVDLDGKTLDEKNYTKKEGSTIITLNDDFVYTLSEGEHTIDIVSTTGTASATFIIKFVSDTTENKNPKTGTNLNVSLWMSLLAVSGAAIVGVLYKRKKYMK